MSWIRGGHRRRRPLDECIDLCNDLMRQGGATADAGLSGANFLCCSFCGESHRDVQKLIAGPSVFICDECIELCKTMIREEGGTTL